MNERKPYFPTEWADNQVMDVLFSPFRDNRDVNPESWDRKMKFWTEMIYHECRFTKSPVVNINSLPHRFVRNGKIPVCLENVLQEIQRNGKSQSVSDFQAAARSTGWLSWGLNTFVKQPLNFSLRTAQHLMGWQPAVGDMVLTEVIKEQADALVEHQMQQQLLAGEKFTLTSRVVSMEKLLEEGGVCREQKVLDLVLLQLLKEKRVAVSCTESEKGKRVVRFQGEKGEQIKEISELELQSLKLSDTSTRLLTQIEEISKEMERCRSDAKFYLQKGLRNSAKNALRRKKMLETLMTKRQASLENIEGLLQRINNAESDKMVLDAYADGTKAYKSMVASMGLTPDNIDNIMDDVHEVFNVQEEIDDSLQQGPKDPNLDVSITDLESELEAILAADKGKDEEQLDQLATDLDALKFPEVPKFDPSTDSPQATNTSKHEELSPFR